MQLQTSSLVAQTAAFFNAAGRSNSIAANGHLPLFSAATFMGLPFNKFLCRRFRRLSQTHQTRAEIDTGPLAPKRSEYGEGVLFLFTDWQHEILLCLLRIRCVKDFSLFSIHEDTRSFTKSEGYLRVSSCNFVDQG